MNDRQKQLDKAITALKRAIANTWLMRQLLRNPARSQAILIGLIVIIVVIGATTQ